MNKYVIGSSMVFAIGSLLLYKNLCNDKTNNKTTVDKTNNKTNIDKTNNKTNDDKIILSKKRTNDENECANDIIEDLIDEIKDSIDIKKKTVTFNETWEVIN